MEKGNYLKKWLEGTLDEKEREFFESTDEYRSLEKLSKYLKSFKAPHYDISTEYERLLSKRSTGGKLAPFDWFDSVLKIAAVLTLIAGAYLILFHKFPTVVTTVAAEKKELRLPDSSFVALNAVSELSFNQENWRHERKIRLRGEGFFQVTKGPRFDVVTSNGIITVLGTSFNVKDRDGYFEVTCYEGSVQVQRGEQVVKLLPGQRYTVIDGLRTTENIQGDLLPGWRGNESSFKRIPFLHVVREFERQYDLTVTVTNIDTRETFTGAFTHNDISLALQSITLPLNLKYEIIGDKKIILTGEKR